MKAVNIFKIVLVAVAVVFVVACAKKEDSLIGVWSNVQTAESVAFRADKSGVFVVKDRPSLAFTWTVVENNRVKIDINFQGNVRTLFGRLDGDSFILEGSGQQAIYRKDKQ
jgi:hypothetical protein